MSNKILNSSLHTNKKHLFFLLIGVLLIGANLRVPLTSVGALIPLIRDDLNVSNALIGTITTIPLLAFAFISPLVPKIASSYGMELSIAASLVILIIGIITRSLNGTVSLFLGTALIGLAIAFGNVLIPGIVKINFPTRIGLMTGLYAIFMNIFGALGSGISVPIAKNGLGWKGALLIWVILTFISLIVWLPQILKNKNQTRIESSPSHKENLYKSKLAWKITLFMGVQSLLFYTLITWLPDILYMSGLDATTSGWMVFLMQCALIVMTFIVPIIAEKLKNQISLSIATGTLFIVGFIGLLYGGTTFIPLWVILMGIASGSAFSLSMMFFTLRTRDGIQAAKLSGMAQSFGYLLAAVGPILIGGVEDITGSWTVSIIILIILALLLLFSGVGAGKNVYISKEDVRA